MPMQVKYAKNFRKGVKNVNLLFLNPLNLDFLKIFNLFYRFLEFVSYTRDKSSSQYMERDKHVNFLSLSRCFDGPSVCSLPACLFVHFHPFIMCSAWNLSE